MLQQLQPRQGLPLHRSRTISDMPLPRLPSEAATPKRRASMPARPPAALSLPFEERLGTVGERASSGLSLVSDGASSNASSHRGSESDAAATYAPSAAGPLTIAGLVLLVVSSGVGTNIAFEMLSRDEPGCATLLTLFQYGTALAGGLRGARAHLLSPRIPRRRHAVFTLLMLLTAWAGNLSVDWKPQPEPKPPAPTATPPLPSGKVPFPLYLIIKSANLVSNMLAGRLLMKKTYRRGQVRRAQRNAIPHGERRRGGRGRR
eukprot:2025881-Prymnesium_polylepis.2